LSILTNDPLTQLSFAVYENKGIFALLLGSGLSRAAEIPTGWEITLDVIRRVAVAQGIEEQPDWAVWYREEVGEEPSYSKLLAELASSPEERRSILHSYIEPTAGDRQEGRKVPTGAHKAIADLVRAGYIRVIITTNFDRLIENALRERGVEPTVVASIDALSGAEPITHSACYVLKLHGDYKDARILNTDEELSAYPTQINTVLDRIFDEHGLIVSGWSSDWDHALRAALLRAPNRRYPVYWTARSKLTSGAQALADHRGARVIQISDADKFFTALRERVETLAQSHRQNPLSVDLLTGSAKRYLAKPEYRIQLDDLFTQELGRVLTRTGGSEFSPQPPWDRDVFRARVRKYESATEGLARMMGVLGRWGDDTEFPIVLNLIRSLLAHAENVAGGLTVYLNVRSYPALLVFTAYALGLTRAERWSALHQLFAATVETRHGQTVRTIESLFLWAWKGTGENAWKHLEGLDNKRTPLSESLLALFAEWAKTFVGLVPDFEMMFERFELLGSLAFLESHDKGSLQSKLAGDPHQEFAWTPVGRGGWHWSNTERLLSEIQAEPQKEALLKAGFAHGDPEFLELAIQDFRRIAGQMRW
jgi:phosphoserine phosphatase